jgi:hypothetical protein
VQSLMVDTTPLRSASLGAGPPPARQVAEALGARYLCLPQAQSGSLARVIRDQHAASA